MARRVGEKHRLGPHRDPQIEDAVRAATRDLLVERGYRATSVDAIASRAGVSRQAMYRRWPSKVFVVHWAVFPNVPLSPVPLGTDLQTDVARVVRGAVELFTDPAVKAALPGLLADMSSDPDIESSLNARNLTGAHVAFGALLAGAGDDVRPGVDSDTVFDALGGAAVMAMCIRGREDADAFAESLIDILLHGILPRA